MTPLPSAWGISRRPLLIMSGLTVALSLFFVFVDPVAALVVAGTTLTMFVGGELLAASLLRRGLLRFARVLEDAGAGPPEVAVDRDGGAVLRWPAWGVSVGGAVRKFTVRDFAADVGTRHVRLRLRDVETGALAVLHLVGRGPGVVGAWDGRLPVAVGAEVAVWVPLVAPFTAILLHFIVPWWLAWGVGAALVALLMSSFLVARTVNRHAAHAYLRGLVQGGVRVDEPIVIWNGMAPEILVPTSEGPLVLTWVSAFAAERFYVEEHGVQRRVLRQDAYDDARAWAAAPRAAASAAKFRSTWAPAGVA